MKTSRGEFVTVHCKTDKGVLLNLMGELTGFKRVVGGRLQFEVWFYEVATTENHQTFVWLPVDDILLGDGESTEPLAGCHGEYSWDTSTESMN